MDALTTPKVQDANGYREYFSHLKSLSDELQEYNFSSNIDLENFEQNWERFLEEELPREIKQSNPLLEETQYLEGQARRIEQLWKFYPEFAAIEICTYFEEASRRFELSKEETRYLEDILMKRGWSWKETLSEILDREDYELVKDAYDEFRNGFFHEEDFLIGDVEVEIDELAEVYQKYSPFEIEKSGHQVVSPRHHSDWRTTERRGN